MSRYYLDCWTFFIKYLSHTVVVGQWTMGRREMLAELCLKLVGKKYARNYTKDKVTLGAEIYRN